MANRDSLIDKLAAEVTERCKQRIAEARKHPQTKPCEGLFKGRKQMLGL